MPIVTHLVIAMTVVAIRYFPIWYQKRLVRDMINEAMAERRLDDGARCEIASILETGKHRDVINWIRQNETIFPGELLAITEKTIKARKKASVMLVGCAGLYILLAFAIESMLA